MKKLIIFIVLIYLTLSGFSQVMQTTESVNLRSSPEIKENKICVIPKGRLLIVVQDYFLDENWIKVNYFGNIGYVNNRFIKNITTNINKHNLFNSGNNNSIRYYKNSKGERVQSPTWYNSIPIGATAECYDGTYSFSRNWSGTCSHHGGVKRWLN